MEKTNKTVMQESAKVLSEKIDIPDGPNVAPSPGEHLAAQGKVKPARHAGETETETEAGEEAEADDGLPDAARDADK